MNVHITAISRNIDGSSSASRSCGWMLAGCFAVGLLWIAGASWAQTPLASSFTYQGQLRQSGTPATSLYDLEFNLHSASDPTPGTLIGTSTQCAVQVENGLFTVEIDFGDVFGSDARWLEIGVAPAGPCDSSTEYSYLVPLQPLTATPFAQSSARATEAETAVLAEDADRLEGHEASDFLSITGGVLTGNLEISRSGATPLLKIKKEDAGGEADLLFELGGNQMYNYYDGSRLRWFRSPNDLMTLTNSGNLGLGTSTPTSRLHLIGNNSPWTLRIEGLHTLLSVDSGGNTAPDDRVAQISNGAGTEFTVMGSGRVGLGTGQPEARLDVRGNVVFDGQKACVAVASGGDRAVTIVPATWQESTCAAFSRGVFSPSAGYRLACIFRTTSSVAIDQGAPPAINCGW